MFDDSYDGQQASWDDLYAAKQEVLTDYGGELRYPGQGRDTQGREVIDIRSSPRRAARGVLDGAEKRAARARRRGDTFELAALSSPLEASSVSIAA